MGLSCGIVGLPNVGKSTLFNALTNAGAQAANYPFCTIDPNVGVVPIRDARLDRPGARARVLSPWPSSLGHLIRLRHLLVDPGRSVREAALLPRSVRTHRAPGDALANVQDSI